MSSTPASVTVTEYATADGGASFKLQAGDWELNIHLKREEVALLSNLRAADWSARRSIRAGIAAGAPVFWVYDDEHVGLLVGQDDEAWDIAVRVPSAPLEAAIARAAAR